MEISIIGGGITGLSTALALNKLGIKSTVYEQAQSLNEIGAGVWLQPNAMQVLKWLDLDKEVTNKGCVLNKMELSYPDLRPIKKIKNTVVADKYGNRTVAIHRGKLQKILYDKFIQFGKVELGMRYLSHKNEGTKIQIQFNDKIISTDILLGADGIKSKVRSTIGLASEYRNSNQICCRGLANIQLPNQLKNEGKEIWAHKLRFGFSQLSENIVYFFAVMNREKTPETINTKSLSTLYKDFDPIVSKIINATEKLHIGGLMDLKRIKTWYNNSNTCLLGDAAHATTPNMGQGACQGIEDAYYIANSLKNHSTVLEAFRNFETKRRKKVDYVVNNSWKFGQMAHNPLGQLLLKRIMKITPEKILSKQMNKLYHVENL